jgi:hypothetical protein
MHDDLKGQGPAFVGQDWRLDRISLLRSFTRRAPVALKVRQNQIEKPAKSAADLVRPRSRRRVLAPRRRPIEDGKYGLMRNNQRNT